MKNRLPFYISTLPKRLEYSKSLISSKFYTKTKENTTLLSFSQTSQELRLPSLCSGLHWRRRNKKCHWLTDSQIVWQGHLPFADTSCAFWNLRHFRASVNSTIWCCFLYKIPLKYKICSAKLLTDSARLWNQYYGDLVREALFWKIPCPCGHCPKSFPIHLQTPPPLFQAGILEHFLAIFYNFQ